MIEHHKQTIEKVIDHFKKDDTFLALLIVGSVAKGLETAGSDVDIILIATDREYQKRIASKNIHVVLRDICDYPGGYVDGKIHDIGFLEEIADHGGEPARFAFKDAIVAFCRDSRIEQLVEKISAYPSGEKKRKLESFHSQIRVLMGFIAEAETRKDIYYLNHAVKELALFGGRLILAHNNILFPYHKWFLHEVRNAPDRPETIVELMEKLLAEPSKANADLFAECVLNFRQWPMPQPNEWVRFMEDSEWNWRNGNAPVGEC
jgi:predicted nucleotidyltransferase